MCSASLCAASLAYALNPDLRFYQYGYIAPDADSHLDTGVFDVVEDHAGFLWMASTRGLLRFDGFDTITYRTAEHPGLLSNQPGGLYIDDQGQLFVASQSGLSRYDGETFTPIISGNKLSAHIQALDQDDQGRLWLGSEQGLWTLDGQSIDAQWPGVIDQVRSITWHDQRLYVGATGVVHVIHDNTLNSIALPAALATERVHDLEFHQGQIIGATHAGMFRLDQGVVTLIDSGPAAGLAIDLLLSDRDNNLWFGGDREIGRFFPNGAVELPGVEDESTGWVPQLTRLIEDSAGRHWHASRYFGLSGLIDTPVRRISYTEGLPSSDVLAMTEDASGKVYVATNMGISGLTGETIERVLDEDFDRSGRTRAMLVDGQRRLWVGSNSGLRAFDLETKAWLPSTEDTSIQIPVNALALAQGTANELWVGTDLGLYRVSPQSRTSILAADGMAIESLLYDHNGTLWIGTEDGLASLHGGNFSAHATDLPRATGKVVSMAQLDNGDLVAATATEGLIVRHGSQWLQFGESQGLPPESLIDIEVRNGTLWMITTGGVFRTSVTALDGSVAQLDVQPVITQKRYRGLHSDYCCRGANQSSALVASGVLVASTDDGLITFDLDAADAAGEPPQPYIKSIKLGDTPVAFKAGAQIMLDARHAPVRIDYSALDLAHGPQLTFRYRLRGLDDTWIEMGSARTVHFSSLPTGSFAFELQASALPGVWSSADIAVTLVRQPSFVESTAFKLGIWAASLLAVLGVVWLRTAATRRRHRQLESAIRERTGALHEVNEALEQRNSDLRRASETDTLTGLINRRFFDSRQTDKQLGHNLSEDGVMIMLDIDHFKRVNDTYGHGAGDEILRQFADVMRSVTRQSDLVARWGGEEFMMLCRCPADDATIMLNRLLSAIRDHRFTLPDGEHLPVTSSLGAVQYPLWPNKSVADRLAILLEFADAALYAVKAQGRDGWALLRSGASPNFDLKVRRVGPLLETFIEKRHLSWHTNRTDIAPTHQDAAPRSLHYS